MPRIAQEARLSISGGDIVHLYRSPRIREVHPEIPPGAQQPKPVKTGTALMDMSEVATMRAMPKVVTEQTDKDFSAEQYVVAESTSAWQLVNSDIMRKALHACIANQAYDEKISTLLETKPKQLEKDSVKLRWRRKRLTVDY